MIFPKCDDRAVCCTNPDIGGLVTPQDCIDCKKKQAMKSQNLDGKK